MAGHRKVRFLAHMDFPVLEKDFKYPRFQGQHLKKRASSGYLTLCDNEQYTPEIQQLAPED